MIPVLSEGALRFVGRTTFDALGSEKAHSLAVGGRRPDPAHAPRPGAPTSSSSRPRRRGCIGTYAAGISDDLLTNVLLATRAPVVLCPAMHTEMWEHPAVQDNLRTLRGRGVHVVPPEEGRLAGGDVGAGRLAEPATIVAAVERVLTEPDLAGLHVLVTAGGTREPIDPVRFLSNRSSGKQGHAIADEAARRGAKVTLVTTTDRAAAPGVDVVRVQTAAEMEQAVLSRSDGCDVVVMAAAVADFRPGRGRRRRRSRRTPACPQIVLEPTTDILAALGAPQASRADDRRVRGRNRRRRGQRARQAGPQGRRPRSSRTMSRRPARASSTTPTPSSSCPTRPQPPWR